MANRTVKNAHAIHGIADPKRLFSAIVLGRILDDTFWKEHLFAVNASHICEIVVKHVKCVGATYGGRRRPSKFLCCLLKLLQIAPSKEIIHAYLKQKEFRYLRCLGAVYIRMCFPAREVYALLEPLFTDRRRICERNLDGSITINYIDKFMWELIWELAFCNDIAFYEIPDRLAMEEKDDPLEAYISPLADELEQLELEKNARDDELQRQKDKVLEDLAREKRRNEIQAEKQARKERRNRLKLQIHPHGAVGPTLPKPKGEGEQEDEKKDDKKSGQSGDDAKSGDEKKEAENEDVATYSKQPEERRDRDDRDRDHDDRRRDDGDRRRGDSRGNRRERRRDDRERGRDRDEGRDRHDDRDRDRRADRDRRDRERRDDRDRRDEDRRDRRDENRRDRRRDRDDDREDRDDDRRDRRRVEDRRDARRGDNSNGDRRDDRRDRSRRRGHADDDEKSERSPEKKKRDDKSAGDEKVDNGLGEKETEKGDAAEFAADLSESDEAPKKIKASQTNLFGKKAKKAKKELKREEKEALEEAFHF